jgi:hypothetical protein
MLEQIEAGQRAEDLKMNVLQAIQYITKGWNEVSPDTIRNCWRHTNILSAATNADLRNLSDNVRRSTDTSLDDLAEALKSLHFPDAMNVEEFLNLPDEDIVYEMPDDDQIIAELVDMFKQTPGDGDIEIDEMDDSVEVPVVNSSSALNSLEMVCTFLLQQDDASEYVRMAGMIEKFIREKQTSLLRQTTIDQYFG